MEYRNGKIIDVIDIIYTKPDRDKKVKLFGKTFIKNNKNKLIIIYNNKKYELSEYFSDFNDSDEEYIPIKLIGISNITNMNYMFYECINLFSISINFNFISDLSKLDNKNYILNDD